MIQRNIFSTMLAAAMTVATFAMVPSAPASAQANPTSCDRYARDYANSRQNTAGNLVGGAIAGAVGGALLGRLAGKDKVDNGAAIGAGVGAIGGVANTSSKWRKRYDRAYRDCMQAAYRPAPGAYAAPEPGTPAWYDYCRAKYRSFNSRTGLYLSTSGQYKPCQ